MGRRKNAHKYPVTKYLHLLHFISLHFFYVEFLQMLLDNPFSPYIFTGKRNECCTHKTIRQKKKTRYIRCIVSTFAHFSSLFLPFDSFVHIKEQNGGTKKEQNKRMFRITMNKSPHIFPSSLQISFCFSKRTVFS